ncbi:replication initiator protein [Dipodfec virus UA06Rod_17]|uniref:Replication initiator protein n=1 Tax=Dipodfec virus UA06Rod_17 TaxID=2929318 RepID=A0A976N258_9VIRU|nr:replication initiator protein [Dipodfec virus UA06Rod_17]
MCFFPLPNNNVSSAAYRKGVVEFDCGSCPECLRKRSNVWALRSVFEARLHEHSCMITLTYDKFKYENNPSAGELPVDPTIVCNKRHIQLFIKRLRKWWSKEHSTPIKYLCCAEYGNRTHRAHYHLILFGVDFPDKFYYKKSKRNNPIYMSATLRKLWGHGICTIDSVQIRASVAKYCTKYVAKQRSGDTFMLCSQGIGRDALLQSFNGLSYYIDGQEYPIPRFIWNEYIMRKYSPQYPFISFKYVNKPRDSFDYSVFEESNLRRSAFRAVRDVDPLYIRYLDYWSRKSALFEKKRKPAFYRLFELPRPKYQTYITKALACLQERKFFPFSPAPYSNCISSHYRYLDRCRRKFIPLIYNSTVTCPYPSRPYRTSDTKYLDEVDNYEIYDLFPVQSAQKILKTYTSPLTFEYKQTMMDLSEISLE